MKHPQVSEEERERFRKRLDDHSSKGRLLVYLDESGFEVDSVRHYGYAQKGKRCYGIHDWNKKGRVNVIGAITDMNLITATLFPFNINADVFHQWVIQDLLPKLPPESVVVMDNASFHKRAETREAIIKHGCFLEFLPVYSPDLNPIEHFWAKLKNWRKRLRCTVDELFQRHIFYTNLN